MVYKFLRIYMSSSDVIVYYFLFLPFCLEFCSISLLDHKSVFVHVYKYLQSSVVSPYEQVGHPRPITSTNE